MTVTNHMLRQKIAEINRKTRHINSASTGYAGKVLEDDGTVLLMEKDIVAVEGEYLITSDDKKYRLFSPMPCLHWKCLAKADKSGRMVLKKKLSGLFVTDGCDSYCLGVSGHSDEFEVRFQVGAGEVRLNSSFLNINSPHIVENGVEKE